MADSQYPYPPDQFDREAATTAYHGAHRAEEPFWKQNLVYIAIIAAALIVLFALLFALGRGGGGGEEQATQSPSASETATPSQPSAEPTEESPSEEPPAEPDRGVNVTVINAGGINGLAGSWRDTLEGSGWTDVSVATADERAEQPRVVYRDEADRATAQALAEEVGVGEPEQSDEFDGPITFVATEEPSGEG